MKTIRHHPWYFSRSRENTSSPGEVSAVPNRISASLLTAKSTHCASICGSLRFKLCNKTSAIWALCSTGRTQRFLNEFFYSHGASQTAPKYCSPLIMILMQSLAAVKMHSAKAIGEPPLGGQAAQLESFSVPGPGPGTKATCTRSLARSGAVRRPCSTGRESVRLLGAIPIIPGVSGHTSTPGAPAYAKHDRTLARNPDNPRCS